MYPSEQDELRWAYDVQIDALKTERDALRQQVERLREALTEATDVLEGAGFSTHEMRAALATPS